MTLGGRIVMAPNIMAPRNRTSMDRMNRICIGVDEINMRGAYSGTPHRYDVCAVSYTHLTLPTILLV